MRLCVCVSVCVDGGLGWQVCAAVSASKTKGRVWDPCVSVEIFSPRAMWQLGIARKHPDGLFSSFRVKSLRAIPIS